MLEHKKIRHYGRKKNGSSQLQVISNILKKKFNEIFKQDYLKLFILNEKIENLIYS